ncbi:MAG: ribonuclease III [Clostridia bacterium]|nr:ribonuclease III [Oscillospiraceae bacterium]MBQ7960782.1 ribonuclease III [Clostridia bacterium]
MNIGYEFKDRTLLELAMTHISLANDMKKESNQRLEFLGDSVLSYIIAEEIYRLYPDCAEGELTKIRAALVCEKSLAELARRLDLGSGIKFGRSEAKSDGINKDSILADTFEAVLGAIYLDSDDETAKKWVLGVFGDRVKNVEIISDINYKSELQIFFQKRDKNTDVVRYQLKEKTGPDHNPSFVVEAVYQGNIIGRGKGKSRKIAEQDAAKNAFERMGK